MIHPYQLAPQRRVVSTSSLGQTWVARAPSCGQWVWQCSWLKWGPLCLARRLRCPLLTPSWVREGGCCLLKYCICFFLSLLIYYTSSILFRHFWLSFYVKNIYLYDLTFNHYFIYLISLQSLCVSYFILLFLILLSCIGSSSWCRGQPAEGSFHLYGWDAGNLHYIESKWVVITYWVFCFTHSSVFIIFLNISVILFVQKPLLKEE